jgi:hypothetical protein
MKITKSLLCEWYGVNSRKLSEWIEDNQEIRKFWGIRNTCFRVREQRLIFRHLGEPPVSDMSVKMYILNVLS